MNEMCSKSTGNVLIMCQVEENVFSGTGRSNAVQSAERNIQTIIYLTALGNSKGLCKLM